MNDDNLIPLKPVGKLTPFGKFCCTIGHLPASYMISMTYEEQILWFCDFLKNTVIPAVNTNAEAVAELQSLYITLKEYVDNYFDDLDIQEEVNTKLNEMAEGGQLAEIINQEIFDELNNNITILDGKVDDLEERAFGPVPKFHFIDKLGQYGDSIAIELENNNVLIDLGYVDGLDNLIAYLVQNEITKFNYMMISHWDIDHSSTTEGFKRVIENANLDFSDCTFILPPQCDWSNTTGLEGQELRCEQITNYLIANNYTIKYPTELEKITIDDNNFMKFYNYNPSFITEYETTMLSDANTSIDHTQSNNICGVMEFNTFGKVFLFAGDIQYQAEENIADELPPINVLKIQHHGVNRYTHPDFIAKVLPEIGVIMNTTSTPPLRPLLKYFCNNGGILFTTNESGTIVISLDNYANIIPISENGAYNPIYNNYIQNGDDLDDYILQGDYIFNSYDENNPVLNVPNEYLNQFNLKVETITNTVIYQTLTTMNSYPFYWIRKSIDGTNWSDWKRISIYNFSFLSAGITNDHTLSTNAFEKLILDKTIAKNDITNSLTLVNTGEIKIGKGISQIEVSATVNLSSLTANDRLMVAIYVNNTIYTRLDKVVAGGYDSFNIAGQIINVSENDLISLQVRNLQSRGVISSSTYATNLTVKTLQ